MTNASEPRPPASLPEAGHALTTSSVGPADPGWTPARMADFIVELAASQCVATAARAVGMSRQSAYKLRAREEGEAFDIAWAAALEQGHEQLYRAALARAVSGIEVPVYQRGELIGSRRHFDERLTCFLLAQGKQRKAPLPRERRDAIDSWNGHFGELLEQIRAGADAGEKGDFVKNA